MSSSGSAPRTYDLSPRSTSGRVNARTSTGAPSGWAARSRTASSNASSAACTSSSSRMAGRCAPIASSSERSAACSASVPSLAGPRSVVACAASDPSRPNAARTAVPTSAGDAPGLTPRYAATASTAACNGRRRPYVVHRPCSTVTPARRATNSAASRVLPCPASPLTTSTRERRAEATPSRAACSTPRASVRPTNGVTSERSRTASSPSSSCTPTSSGNPRTARCRSGPSRSPDPATSTVRTPMSVWPPSARSHSRAARLTASPATENPPSSRLPATSTSPVFTPIRSAGMRRRSDVRLIAATSACSATAACAARAASSSWPTGAPNTAMNPSPCICGTDPPNDSTTRRSAVIAGRTKSCTSSGSSRLTSSV